MPFRPGTFDLSQQAEVLITWTKVANLLQSDPNQEIYTNIGVNKSKSLSLVLLFNRVRSAVRAQYATDGHAFDNIEVTSCDLQERGFAVRFRDRQATANKFELTDIAGHPIA